MIRRIIAATKGDDAGRDAIALAHAIAGPLDAELLVLGVYPDPLLPFPPRLERHTGAHATAELRLRRDRDALAPGARVRAVPDASPSRALRHAVQRERCDLLVLGPNAAAGDGTVRAGRHARQVLHDSPCAVALAPRGLAERGGALSQIAVAYDGGPESEAALDLARALAAASHATIRLMYVVEDRRPILAGDFGSLPYVYDWSAVVDRERRAAEELVEMTVARHDEVAGGMVLLGDPGPELARASEDADLLIVGSRRWGALARVVLGSTAEDLAHHAHCPVLFAMRPATAGTGRGEHRQAGEAIA